MYFYQVQKHYQRTIANSRMNDANYVCSLTMNASIVLAIIQSMKETKQRVVIDLSRPEIAQLVSHLEKCMQNRSYFKMIIRDYKALLTLEDFDKGLVELTAVCHFLLEDPLLETNKVSFIQTSFLEGRGER
ncbi:hypothetical protein AEA09_03725 [Lysinibacillus contaminans]|uniref:Uncharacterized protein n=1 Tax=Lysinibacillus contaminans TaxID=1293441 RepID=A0ABR5JZ82_9BACI|nr:hypothetical protein [Lysinibacillus contaminans]KOS67755.1 hypothetical protein AEA09_03725 [Lysinibacillus contaminans]